MSKLAQGLNCRISVRGDAWVCGCTGAGRPRYTTFVCSIGQVWRGTHSRRGDSESLGSKPSEDDRRGREKRNLVSPCPVWRQRRRRCENARHQPIKLLQIAQAARDLPEPPNRCKKLTKRRSFARSAIAPLGQSTLDGGTPPAGPSAMWSRRRAAVSVAV